MDVEQVGPTLAAMTGVSLDTEKGSLLSNKLVIEYSDDLVIETENPFAKVQSGKIIIYSPPNEVLINIYSRDGSSDAWIKALYQNNEEVVKILYSDISIGYHQNSSVTLDFFPLGPAWNPHNLNGLSSNVYATVSKKVPSGGYIVRIKNAPPDFEIPIIPNDISFVTTSDIVGQSVKVEKKITPLDIDKNTGYHYTLSQYNPAQHILAKIRKYVKSFELPEGVGRMNTENVKFVADLDGVWVPGVMDGCEEPSSVTSKYVERLLYYDCPSYMVKVLTLVEILDI